MKKKNFLFASCLLGIFAFSSCEKNLYDESKQPEEETKMTDLIVPKTFDWSDTQEVKAQITPAETIVSVYLDKECKEEALLFQMDMNIESNDNQSVEFPIAIPTYVENVYVKYEGVDRISIVPVQDGKIAIKAPQIQNIKSRAVINTKNSNEYGLLSINGTLMFEDMYPQLGDYDFNDFVARYNLRILYKYSRGKYYAHKMCISVQIRAVGGIYKYEPYIRLTKVKADNIIIETTEKNVKSIKGPNGEAIISYKSPTPPSGYKYYNTEKNEMTKPDKFKEIWITLKNPIEYEDVMDKNYNIDMYIAKENHKQEIHLKGYEPVYDQHQDYADKNNFVWGIRTWGIFDHAIEGKNFLKAYPQFKGWVTSGGKEYKRWWEEVDYRYVIRN
ncbi:MAG: LruC domain-containing protein [Bacteroides caccae]|jgi:LruC domain-containing protein